MEILKMTKKLFQHPVFSLGLEMVPISTGLVVAAIVGAPLLREVDSILTKMRHVTEVKGLYFLNRWMLLLICKGFCISGLYMFIYLVDLAELDSELECLALMDGLTLSAWFAY